MARKPSQAEVALKLEERRSVFRILESVAQTIKVAVWIATSWIPLQPLERMVHDLSGKTTQFNGVLNITLAVSVTSSAGWAISAGKSHRRKQTIRRLRAREDTLEKVIEDLGAPLPQKDAR